MVGSRMYVSRKIGTGEYKLVSHGYLYSMKTGIMKVYEGDIYERLNKKFDNRCIFVVDGRRHNLCNAVAGEMFNGLVWLPEKDDNKAIDILIDNEKLAISKLRDEIEYHEKRIELLRNAYCEVG